MVPKPTGTAAIGVAGKPFYLMQRIDGEALGIRITRGANNGPSRRARIRTRIHRIVPPQPDLDFLGSSVASLALDAISSTADTWTNCRNHIRYSNGHCVGWKNMPRQLAKRCCATAISGPGTTWSLTVS